MCTRNGSHRVIRRQISPPFGAELLAPEEAPVENNSMQGASYFGTATSIDNVRLRAELMLFSLSDTAVACALSLPATGEGCPAAPPGQIGPPTPVAKSLS